MLAAISGSKILSCRKPKRVMFDTRDETHQLYIGTVVGGDRALREHREDTVATYKKFGLKRMIYNVVFAWWAY